MSAAPRVVRSGRVVLATAAAFGIACLVHLLVAGMLVAGLLLVVLGWETVVQPMIGLVLLVGAAQLRPRLGRPDPELPTLRRVDAPALYTLLDDTADAVGVRHIDTVQVGTEFALRVSTCGIRRRRRLELGLPLWLTLAPQQRVTAVAHELGHFASRDIRRGTLIGAALSSLAGRAEIPEHAPRRASAGSPSAPLVSRHADGMATASARFKARGRAADWALWIPKLVVKGAHRLLMRLTRPSARLTEFQADAVAARVASTEATVSALCDQLLAGAVNAEVHRLAVTVRTFRPVRAAQSTDRDIWAEVAAHAAALPRRAGEELPAEDGGLPSVSSRIARLHPGAGHPAVVTLDAAGADAIEDELREPKRVLAKKIIQDCVHA